MIRAISPVAIHIVLVALPSLTLVACGGDAGPTELGGESFVQIHIRIEGEGAFHALNDTLAASLVGADSEGTFRQIQQTRATWRSLDRGVAVIEDDSLVISRSVGTARIVVTFSELSDTVEVTVVQVPAFLEINFERDTLLFGDSLALRHAVLDSSRVALPAAVVEWSSNDPAVAAVDAGGLVRGVGPGLARVEAAHGSLVAHGRVEVLPPFVTVSAGGGHTCGLLEGGAAYCWGAALRGQTGVGGFWNQFNRAEPVAGELEFTQLDAGDQHTCALDQGGVAYCWGWNEHGQLGVEDRADRDVPTLVDTELRFSEIRAGRRITCGVSVDGAMFCWGRVQLEEEAPPAEGIQPILEGLVFARVDVGYDHGCGLATTGEIYCWGDEWVWEWGGNVTPEPRLASEGSSFASLTTGGMLCGVLLGGGGSAWGM